LEGVFVQILDNVLLIIIENEVMGNERLNDGFTRSGLCVFAQAWPDVATESHKAKEEITDQIFVFASLGGVSQLGEDFIIERSALPCDFLFEQHDIDEDRHHIARVRQISWWIKILEFEEGVNSLTTMVADMRPLFF
jgi:hypothetical protein